MRRIFSKSQHISSNSAQNHVIFYAFIAIGEGLSVGEGTTTYSNFYRCYNAFSIYIRETTEKQTYLDYFKSYSIDNQRIIGRSINKNSTTIVLLKNYYHNFYCVFHFGYSRKAFRLQPQGLLATAVRLLRALLLPVNMAVTQLLKYVIPLQQALLTLLVGKCLAVSPYHRIISKKRSDTATQRHKVLSM